MLSALQHWISFIGEKAQIIPFDPSGVYRYAIGKTNNLFQTSRGSWHLTKHSQCNLLSWIVIVNQAKRMSKLRWTLSKTLEILHLQLNLTQANDLVVLDHWEALLKLSASELMNISLLSSSTTPDNKEPSHLLSKACSAVSEMVWKSYFLMFGNAKKAGSQKIFKVRS